MSPRADMIPYTTPDDPRPFRPASAAAGELYLGNLAALWTCDPLLASRVEAVDSERPGGDLADAPSSPGTDFGPMLERVDAGEVFAFHVAGFGPHLMELFAHAGGPAGEAVFTVFEPDLTHLRDALLRDDYAAAFESGRVLVFTSDDPSALATAMRPFQSLVALGVARIGHAASLARDAEFFAACRRAADAFCETVATDTATTLAHARKTAFNVAANLAEYATTPGLARLRDAYRGMPALLVAAGPSLRKNIEQVKESDGRAVVIAVQTTLKPLLAAGVVPHFVTALDHHEISTRFYEGLPADLATELVAEPKVSPAVLRAWREVPGRKLTLLGNDFAERVLGELKLRKATLAAGSTVAHLSFTLAEWLGCSTAILVGQDLGFSDGLAYTPGTGYDDVWRAETGRFCTFEMKQWEHIARDRAALRRVEDWDGHATYTERRLFSYLQHFERLFAATPMRVIDATEGGAAKRHTERMPLRTAIGAFCTRPLPVAPPPGSERTADVAACLTARRREARAVLRIAGATLPLLRRIRDGRDVDANIARVDALRRELRDADSTYSLVTTLTQASELARFRADRRINAGGLTPLERQRRQVERDVVNVEAFEAAARDFLCLLDTAAPTPQRRAA